LYGRNAAEASRIDSFLDAVLGLETNLGPWVSKIKNLPWSKDWTKDFVTGKQAAAKKNLAGFETALKENKYFVGNSLSIADIVWFCSVYPAFGCAFTAEFLKEFPSMLAHFRRLEALPECIAVMGDKPVVLPESVVMTFAPTVAVPEAPVRYHRLVTITDGKTSMKLKLFKESSSDDIAEAVRNRFHLSASQKIVLIDEDGCDVVVDGTLETGKYRLELV